MNTSRRHLFFRRLLLFLLTGVFVAAACGFFAGQLLPGKWTALDWVTEIAFVAVMAAGSFNFWLYVFGFAFICGKDSEEDACFVRESTETIRTRTAIVMAVLHEDCERVYHGLRETWRSALRAGLGEHCDVFLLSDSTDPAVCAREDELVERLAAEFDLGSPAMAPTDAAPPAKLDLLPEPAPPRRSPCRFFLVRRSTHEGFKAGNIAHFLENHGWVYDFMLVLDADSVMLGRTVRRLILRMQRQANLALLQSVILPIRAVTPFARAMQFSASRCIRLFAAGSYWFFGPDSVYWGHNALIRVSSFMAHCNLPIMPGRPPMGGRIMSHDIVEAALLGRANCAVEWEVQARGSFDETPANVLVYGKRDRRWCQGNFQHFWLIFGDRVPFGHRLYFAIGIFAYLGSLFFLLLLLLGTLQGYLGRVYRLDPATVGSFLGFFLLILLLPRFLGFIQMVWNGASVIRELSSGIIEFLISLVVSPSLFYFHTRFVLEVVSGKKVPWFSQSRNPCEALTLATAARVFWPPTVAGFVWLALALWGTPQFLLYLAPLLTGWILSIPLAVWTSNPAWGAWLARHHLLDDSLSSEELEELGALARPDHRQPPATSAPVSKSLPACEKLAQRS